MANYPSHSEAEKNRIAAVNRYLNLKISKEKELMDIMGLAAQICQTPTALITFIDEDTQHINYKIGFKYDKTDRNISFCTHVIEQHDVMVINDAHTDERFRDNPLVNNDPFIRFYAGSPLTTKDGYNIGSLCVIDQKPRELTQMQIDVLNTLSHQAVTLFEFEALILLLNDQFVETRNSEIKIRSFFESSMACHLLIDNSLRAVYFNKALSQYANRLYNTSIEVGMSVLDFIPSPYIEDFARNYHLALAGTPVQTEREVVFENETLWWFITYEPAYNTDGEIIGVCFNMLDITKKAQQEEKISEQNKSLRAIAEIQSHELRRPVASIMGLFNVWRTENYTPSKEIVEMMEAAVQELDEKIKLIIDHAPL